MRLILIFLCTFCIMIQKGYPQTQPFSLVTALLKPMEYSSCAWGDYDNDGDLDIIVTGGTTSSPVTCLYRNNNGIFEEVNSGLPGFSNTSAEWGDYDNDGDLDLLITGMDMNGDPATKIFRNSSGTFSDSGILLPGVWNGQATWGDFDNDGNLDILVVGNTRSKIMKNQGNNEFTEVISPLIPLVNASCSWVDYNNDGQLDVMISGDSLGGMVSKLYKNEHGIFTEVQVLPAGFAGLSSGKCKWADLNNDGRQDLVLSGAGSDGTGHLVVYRNDGNDQFTLFDNMTSNMSCSSFDIADFDADGYSDIIFIGKVPGCGSTAATMLFQNLGFMQFVEVSTEIPGFKYGDVKWGDFNNDGYTDLVLTGMDGYFAPTSAIYKNNAGSGLFAVNTPPSTPACLLAEPISGKVVLHWNSAVDAQTPKSALTYNLRIGTQPELSDIFPSMADELTGFRRVVNMGNCTADTSWTITGIPAGDYWFSVQALDNGFLPGSFATPVPFTATVGIEEQRPLPVLVYPNPCRDQVRIQIPQGKTRITNTLGQQVYVGTQGGAINTSTWPKGIYTVIVTSRNEVFSSKLIRE